MLIFFNDTATTEIYTLSLHDALPISVVDLLRRQLAAELDERRELVGLEDRRDVLLQHRHPVQPEDRKSTRLNSSHANISYAVFCLKKNLNSASLPLLTSLSLALPILH